jgi:hypothetical protein
MRTVRFAATFGAALGVGIAVVLLSVSEMNLFSDTVDAIIMIVTVSLCPIFLLGSTLYIKSKILFYAVTIVGNGVFYGISAAIIGLGFALFQKLTARNRNE